MEKINKIGQFFSKLRISWSNTRSADKFIIVIVFVLIVSNTLNVNRNSDQLDDIEAIAGNTQMVVNSVVGPEALKKSQRDSAETITKVYANGCATRYELVERNESRDSYIKNCVLESLKYKTPTE